MSGFELFDGDTKMRITYDDRTVMTTDGTLINLLPPEYDISETFNIVFPDIVKDYLYNWRHIFSYTSLGEMVGYDSGCTTMLTACPQEFDQTTNIVSSPPDADIFVGAIRLTRTVAPSHNWAEVEIEPLPPMGVEIPFISGSVLVETALGMARAFSIYVDGGFLKLNRQHSVSTAPGGWDFYGTQFNNLNPQSGGGGENVNGGTRGIPILHRQTVNVPSFQQNASLLSPPYDGRTRRGGPAACEIPNPSAYNYGSTYQAILTGSFGRRS